MSGETIAIGVGAPLSGLAGALGVEMTHAVELAVERHNAQGNDRRALVSAIVRDDEGSASRGASIARDFCEERSLCGVVGHYNSDVTIAAAEIYDAARVPLIAPIASNPSLTEHGWNGVFRLTNRDDSTARAIARHLYRVLGKRHVAVVESRTAYGASMAECFVRSFKEIGGAVAGRYDVHERQRDFGTLPRALDDDIDVVFYGGSFEGAPLLRALRERGVGHLFATGDGCWDVEHFLRPAEGVAEVAEGVLVLSASLSAEHSVSSRDIAERYRQRHGPIGNYALNAYDATRALLAAIDDAATQSGPMPERAAVAASLRRVSLEGVAFPGPLYWDVKGDNASSITVLNIVRNGRFEAVATTGRGERLIVGLDDALPPPMQMGDPAGGNFRGYEVELLHEIAGRLGLELRYRRTYWSRVIEELKSGAVDVVCSAATITEDRRRTVDFSDPYLRAPLAIVSRRDKPATGVKDVTTLGVRRTTTAERYARQRGSEIALRSESNDELYEALISGQIDAVVDDLPIASWFASKLGHLQFRRLADTDGAYALMLRKGNTSLRTRINEILADLEGTGALGRLRARWHVDIAA